MRTRVWAAVVAVALVAVGVFAVVSARRLGTQPPPAGRLADALAGRGVAVLEGDLRGGRGGGGEPVRCAARAFGARPEGLTRAAQATTIYAWVYCRAASGR